MVAGWVIECYTTGRSYKVQDVAMLGMVAGWVMECYTTGGSYKVQDVGMLGMVAGWVIECYTTGRSYANLLRQWDSIFISKFVVIASFLEASFYTANR